MVAEGCSSGNPTARRVRHGALELAPVHADASLMFRLSHAQAFAHIDERYARPPGTSESHMQKR